MLPWPLAEEGLGVRGTSGDVAEPTSPTSRSCHPKLRCRSGRPN